MVADAWFESKFKLLKVFGIAAALGVVAIIGGTFVMMKDPSAIAEFLIGILLLAPFLVYATLLTVWHWKDRYRGEHSNLWGALLLFETSGWLKIVYWFRHIIPDARRTGRYRKTATIEDYSRD